MATHALEQHVALIGFMGAGKTTLGTEVAERLGRPFVDLDREIEDATATPIPQLFERRGEEEFRTVEERLAAEALDDPRPAVIALGGGAVKSEATRRRLVDRALTVLLDVDVEAAWRHVSDSDRPLAQDESSFRQL